MKNNLKILKFFADNKNSSYTIKKVSEKLGINYRIAYQEVMALAGESLISIEKIGNSNICSFNYHFSSKIVEVEQVRKQELFQNKNIRLVFNRLVDAKSPFFILVLFGSYAGRTQTKNSDMDFCLIADSRQIEKRMRSIITITPVDIHLQVFTPKEFRSMIEKKADNIGNEILKNNVILYGIESFYKLIC